MHGIRATRSWSVAGLTLLLGCALVLAGCIRIPLGQGSGTGRPTSSKGKAAAPAMPTSLPPAMVGRWLSAGSWKVLVIRARTSAKGPGGAKAAAGKSFLLVDVEFKNVRMTESLAVNPKDVLLTNASGKRIALARTSPGYNASGMREIGPGYGAQTVFAFQIPKGSAGYTFTFRPMVSGKRAKLQWGVP